MQTAVAQLCPARCPSRVVARAWPITRFPRTLLAHARSRVRVDALAPVQALALASKSVAGRESVAVVRHARVPRAQPTWQMLPAQVRCRPVHRSAAVVVPAGVVTAAAVDEADLVDRGGRAVPVVRAEVSVAGEVVAEALLARSVARAVHRARDASRSVRSAMSTRRCMHRTSSVAFVCPMAAAKQCGFVRARH